MKEKTIHLNVDLDIEVEIHIPVGKDMEEVVEGITESLERSIEMGINGGSTGMVRRLDFGKWGCPERMMEWDEITVRIKEGKKHG